MKRIGIASRKPFDLNKAPPEVRTRRTKAPAPALPKIKRYFPDPKVNGWITVMSSVGTYGPDYQGY